MKCIIKSALKFAINILRDTFLFCLFLLRFMRAGSFKNRIKRVNSGTVCVLANGPSLKEALPELVKNADKTDFIVMNYFALDEAFVKIKPKYYCFADPMFFRDIPHRRDEARKLFEILEHKVDWELLIIVPYGYPDFFKFSGITNRKISMQKVNCIRYTGYPGLRNYFYKKSMASPGIPSVAHLAIYYALNSGYSQINIYGLDNNFFETICVNEKNQLCNKTVHFYEKDDDIKIEPILRSDNGKIYKISEYLEELKNVSLYFDILANYAEYIDVKLINLTKGSFIDSFERAYVNNEV